MNARQANPWAALGALCLGFFMILLDTTIVSIALPTMLRELNAGLNSVVRVISVYLLTYAVPMLFTRRLVDHLGWEWIFNVNVPIVVVAIVMSLLLVPDWQPKHSHSFVFIGILLSSLALLYIVFGVQNGQQYDWGTVWGGITVFEIIGAGVLLLVAFVVWQRVNKREPLLPLQVFANRNFSAGTLTATTVGFAMTGMFLPLVIYIQSVLGLSPTMAGLLTAPMSLLSGIVAPFVGNLSDMVNGKYLVMFGLAALAGGLGVIALQASPTSSPWSFIPALLLCGLGIGCIFSPMSNMTMGSVEPIVM